jgi:hypothetical protein
MVKKISSSPFIVNSVIMLRSLFLNNLNMMSMISSCNFTIVAFESHGNQFNGGDVY